jgi:hypothetical protein
MEQEIKTVRDAGMINSEINDPAGLAGHAQGDAAQSASDPQPSSRRSYINASEVLPPDLLAAVQQHFSGGAIYISAPETPYYAERRKLVLSLHLQGVKTGEIAHMACVSARRVLQILAQTRKKSKK